MWVEKYRPSRLADVAAHKDIIDTISRLTKEDRLPHLLLCGPPGTGKTSTILAVARELYGSNFSQMVLELNASDGASRDRRPPPPARSRRARFHFKIAIAPRARSPVAPILLPPKRRFRGPPTPPRLSRAPRPSAFPSLVFRPRPRYRRRAQRDPAFASTMRFSSTGFKLIILDECDSMTKARRRVRAASFSPVHQTHPILSHR